MRVHTTLAAIAALAVSTAAFASPAASGSHRFHADFPGKTTVSSASTGPVTRRTESCRVGSMLYVVRTFTVPESLARTATKKQTLLDTVRKGTLSKLHGKVVSETNVTVSGKPGRVMFIALPNVRFHAMIKSLIDGNRIYEVIVIHPNDRGSMVAAANFLNSAKLTTGTVTLTKK